jgi:hypothetical protein
MREGVWMMLTVNAIVYAIMVLFGAIATMALLAASGII